MRHRILDQVNKHFDPRGMSRGRGGWMLTAEGTMVVGAVISAVVWFAWVVLG